MVRHSPIRRLSTVLIVAGIGLMLFPGLWIFYTSAHVGPMQSSALAEWEQTLPERTAPTPTGPPDAPRSPQGLVLTIPRLNLTRYVPEGASVGQLRRFGVGRISWTALPDHPGTVGIAGHRTTYGAPFFRLNNLQDGDPIVVTYKGRRFEYAVTGRRIVRPNQVEVLRTPPGEYVVALITCTPMYSARNRLVVFGTLRAVSSMPQP